MLGKFDTWIEEARKNGIKVEVEAQDAQVVTVGKRRVPTVRTVTFEQEKLLVQMTPAAVEGAQLAQNLHVQMPFSTRDGNFEPVWAMEIKDKGYVVENIRPTMFSYQPYQGTNDNPIDDQQFIEALDESLDEVMGYVIDQATLNN